MIISKAELFHKLRRSITIIEHWPFFIIHKRYEINPDLYLKLNSPWLTKAGIKTVFDIGAHTGIWAKTVQYLLPNATIYSFEPILYSFNSLTERMREIYKHKAFNIALGDQSGEYDFYLNEFSASSSFYPVSQSLAQAFPFTDKFKKIRVKVERLDDFFSEYNLEGELLIKVDVQGFENKVINGGKKIFSRAKILLIEVSFEELYEGQPLFEDIYFQLVNMGFRYTGNIDQLINPNNGKVLQADAIFLNDMQ